MNKPYITFLILLILCGTGFWFALKAEGADTGAVSPGTVAEDTTVGSVSWSNYTNVTSSDDLYTTVTTGVFIGTISYYIKSTNFGFSVPNGATIDGVVVSVERHKTGAPNAKDSSLRLVIGGSITGDDKADTVTVWPTSDGTATYGSSSDLWGTMPSASDVNASNFGIVLATTGGTGGGGGQDANFFVDHITITVYYTESGLTVSQTRVQGGMRFTGGVRVQ